MLLVNDGPSPSVTYGFTQDNASGPLSVLNEGRLQLRTDIPADALGPDKMALGIDIGRLDA